MTAPSVEDILRAEGPCLSNHISQILESAGVTATTARKRIERAGGEVRKLHHLPFPKGVKFMFLEGQRETRTYWKALIRDIAVAGPGYAAALAAMHARGGLVPDRHFPIVCGSPIQQAKQLTATQVRNRLTSAELLHRVESAGIGVCWSLKDSLHISAQDDAALSARLRTEEILLDAVADWARNLGMASYDAIRTRSAPGELPQVGTFAWDLSGPSYLRALVRRAADGKPVPGFLVADVVAGETLDENAVAAFIRKCTLVTSMRKLPPVQPMLVADGFTREAFRLGRSHGVMVTTPNLLFGREVAEALGTLLHTLTKAAAMAVEKPEVVDALFNILGQIRGAAANLRGDLFEMLVGHCVVKLDDGSIDIGKKVIDPKSGRQVEIDVFRVKEYRELWAYECKARGPTQVTTLADIDKWLTEKVPRAFNWAQNEPRFRESECHFQFWTCGSFAPDALQRLAEAKAATHRYQIGWKDGPEIRQYAARLRPTSVLEMLDRHFFNHPLARIERKYDGPEDTRPVHVEVELGDLL